LLAFGLTAAIGCGGPEGAIASTGSAVLGDQLGGISAADFAAARANFAQVDSIAGGIGPVFKLGDQIGVNAGESVAQARQMRTAPLWGPHFRNQLLRDGRTGDVGTAIRAHDGQAAAARNAFNALSATDQHDRVLRPLPLAGRPIKGWV
jgi:hypothetical protein